MLPLIADATWDNPALIMWGAIALIVLVPTLGAYLVRWRRSELDASLKHEMIARGMSGDEIEQVLRAKSAKRVDA
jgi:hypothetical protein